jgi:hypothetical protein
VIQKLGRVVSKQPTPERKFNATPNQVTVNMFFNAPGGVSLADPRNLKSTMMTVPTTMAMPTACIDNTMG